MGTEIMDKPLQIPDTRELEADIDKVIALCEGAVIETMEDYAKWKTYKDEELSAKEKKGLLLFNGTKDNPGPFSLSHMAWKKMTEMRDAVVGRYSRGKEILAPKLGAAWNREQDRLAAERRKQEEIARKAEADRQLAEGAGKVEARKILDGRIAIALPPAPAQTQTVGRKPTDYWSAECRDLMLLAKSVVATKTPINALLGIEEIKGRSGVYESSFLNKQSGQLKNVETFARLYPGCVAMKETRA